MAKEHKLPKPASCATNAELEAYANQFDPAGDRRVLAVEILRLRKLIADVIHPDDQIHADVFTEKPVKAVAAKKEADKDVF